MGQREYLAEDTTEDEVWKFHRIIRHQKVAHGDKNYRGSSYNVLLEWETGEQMYEPLSLIGKDDPVTCAIYAKDNNLLDTPGWKHFKKITKREKKLLHLANQAKLHSYRYRPIYKFGYQVPRNHNEVMELDKSAAWLGLQDGVVSSLSLQSF